MSLSDRSCPSCNAQVPAQAAFCMKCGAPIAHGSRQPSTDPLREALVKALGSQYEVMRLLGRGGMGSVYLARETALDRLVAVKVLPPEAGDEQSRERFRREARTAAKLTHPNIVPLYSFGESDGVMYFVMGYVRGESLAARLNRDGKLSPDATRWILSELADALSYAHRQGVVHRDIKPDNILIDDESGRPMLTDFGVARARASGTTLTEMGAVVGTPHYMSPEQASGDRDLDGRSDLYSLGVVGYTLLTGRPPFEGESFRDVIVQHITKQPQPLRTLEPSVPADLAAALERCLAKDPSARWPDANGLKLSLGNTEVEEQDELLPSVQASLDGIVPKLTPLFAGLGFFAWWSYLFPWLGIEDGPWWGIPAVAAWMVLVVIGVFAGIQRAKGTPWRQVFRLILRQPRGWPVWFPRRWRRDNDVWDRFPPFVKRMRLLFGGSNLLIVPIAVLATLHWRTWFDDPIAPVGLTYWGMMLLLAGMLVGALGAVVAIRVWARKHGMEPAKTVKIALAPSGDDRLWRKPLYAGILLPATEIRRQQESAKPETPREYLESIVEAARTLSGPAGDVGADAVSGARQLVESLGKLEQEIESLERDQASADLAGIESKMEDLGPELEGDSDERRLMRRLLSRQLDLAQRLASQLNEARNRRERLLGLLKTLWLQLAELRAGSARQWLATDEISGKIRAVCEDIERHVAALEETARVLN